MNAYKFMAINKTNATDNHYFDIIPSSMFLTQEMMIKAAKKEVAHFTSETHILIVTRNGAEELNTAYDQVEVFA